MTKHDVDPQVLQRAGWTPEELYWEELSENALALPPFEAREFWREAAQAATLYLEADDARQATSLANLALTEELDGNDREARALLQEAQVRWLRAGPWIGRLKPERRARSSLFHLRLMRKHEGGYDQWSKTRFATLYTKGQEALKERLAGVYRPSGVAQIWQEAKPAGFEDARRLLAAVHLIAPDP
ncbi:MAG: tetratricopeptide repeat protein [Kiloniellales bacterium]